MLVRNSIKIRWIYKYPYEPRDSVCKIIVYSVFPLVWIANEFTLHMSNYAIEMEAYPNVLPSTTCPLPMPTDCRWHWNTAYSLSFLVHACQWIQWLFSVTKPNESSICVVRQQFWCTVSCLWRYLSVYSIDEVSIKDIEFIHVRSAVYYHCSIYELDSTHFPRFRTTFGSFWYRYKILHNSQTNKCSQDLV